MRRVDRELLLIAPGIKALPIIHGSLEFAVLVRRVIAALRPTHIAVELPENLSGIVSEAIEHAESIPVISIGSGSELSENSYFIFEPLEPLVEALRSADELKIPYHLVDHYNPYIFIDYSDSFPDTYALQSMPLPKLYHQYLESRRESVNEPAIVRELDALREEHMAQQLRQLQSLLDLEAGESILFIAGFSHIEGVTRELSRGESNEEPLEALLRRRERIDFLAETQQAAFRYSLHSLDPGSAEVLQQPGYYNTSWLMVRRQPRVLAHFNRILLQRSVWRDTVQRYERESGEIFPSRRQRLFFQFARNWSLLSGRLLPDAYRLVLSARAFGGDNFARIFYDLLHFLPRRHRPGSPEPIKLTLDDLGLPGKLIHFRLRYKVKRKSALPQLRSRFKRERYPGEWRDAVRNDPGGICSYPPEDIIVEDFGRYLQKRANSVLSGSEERVQPFSASLLDGIDYRETVRQMPLGKIFVRERNLRGIEAGSVVVVFSEEYERYHWRMVWWGENSQESDMAFYATHPAEELAGPGIFRCRYGGLMLTYPPGRLHNIWDDVDEQWQGEWELTPAERLLVAAIEYNSRRAVVHIAERPPAPRLHALAGRLGQKIVHIPISTLSPVMLGRVHRFHVLDSKDRRDEAGDYIW